jgi:hypothetical protein
LGHAIKPFRIKPSGKHEGSIVNTYDFSRSFVTFVTRDYTNHARIQVEAVCYLTDQQKGTTDAYYLVASCKGEDTHGTSVLFLEPNYDFSAIFSDKEYFIIRVGVPHDLKKNSVGVNTDFFEEVRIAPSMVEGEILATHDDIVHTTLTNRRLNGRTEIADPVGRYHAVIEYPLKTINVNDRLNIYQVDTGPLLLPDFELRREQQVEQFQLAFIAYNKSDEAYFVIQEPTSVIADQLDALKVSHYSRIIGLTAKNTVIAL